MQKGSVYSGHAHFIKVASLVPALVPDPCMMSFRLPAGGGLAAYLSRLSCLAPAAMQPHLARSCQERSLQQLARTEADTAALACGATFFTASAFGICAGVCAMGELHASDW